MTPRERVEAALRWDAVDWVPFTVYSTKLPTSAAERRLRNDGLCPVDRHSVSGGGYRGITTDSHSYVENGVLLTRTVYHTPKGDLSMVRQNVGFTTWTHEHLFKGPDDYEPLLALIESQEVKPHWTGFEKARELWEGDAFVRANLPNAPIQTLISHYMGTMTFSLEWMEREADVRRLLDALTVLCRKHYTLVAESPAFAVNYGGNHTPALLGRERFAEHIVPHWREACEVLQPAGKLVGCHLDDNNKLWADLVADSPLDYIEAFTPAPDCDMTVAEARAAWPDKVLWINFPSSGHLDDDATVAATTRRILDEAGDRAGFLVGVTEDVPPHRWADSFRAILDVCREAGPVPGR